MDLYRNCKSWCHSNNVMYIWESIYTYSVYVSFVFNDPEPIPNQVKLSYCCNANSSSQPSKTMSEIWSGRRLQPQECIGIQLRGMIGTEMKILIHCTILWSASVSNGSFWIFMKVIDGLFVETLIGAGWSSKMILKWAEQVKAVKNLQRNLDLEDKVRYVYWFSKPAMAKRQLTC